MSWRSAEAAADKPHDPFGRLHVRDRRCRLHGRPTAWSGGVGDWRKHFRKIDAALDVAQHELDDIARGLRDGKRIALYPPPVNGDGDG
jgi:hypothetical protein